VKEFAQVFAELHGEHASQYQRSDREKWDERPDQYGRCEWASRMSRRDLEQFKAGNRPVLLMAALANNGVKVSVQEVRRDKLADKLLAEFGATWSMRADRSCRCFGTPLSKEEVGCLSCVA